MKKLPVLWKRLVVDGRTCARCAGTYDALDGALKQLGAALAPLGIEPELTAEALDAPAFAARPSESNRVWIAGRPLEDWLGARSGMSPCCAVCGDSDCRTLELDGQCYETVPQALLVKAGLLAASQLLGASSQAAPSSASCCASGCGCKT